MSSKNTKGRTFYADGPKPRTERGKRRHKARSEAQQAHAKKVWEGGYSTKPHTA